MITCDTLGVSDVIMMLGGYSEDIAVMMVCRSK
jgi:hypothetical protein